MKYKLTMKRILQAPTIFLMAYIYFVQGPIFLYVITGHYYTGIKIEYLTEVIFVSCFAIAGFYVSRPVSFSKKFQILIVNDRSFLAILQTFIYLCLLIVFVNFIFKSGFDGVYKRDILNRIGGIHYTISFFFPLLFTMRIALRNKFQRLDYIAWTSYTIYCLLTYERNFILLFTTILMTYYWNSEKKLNVTKILIILTLAFLMFSLQAIVRAETTTGFNNILETALGQGSNIIIISNVVYWLDSNQVDFLYGSTYLDSILSLFQLNGLEKTGRLTHWFSLIYNPNYRLGGFGFSLDAEAYLNFGYTGVFIVFMFVGFLMKSIWRASITRGTYLSKFLSAYLFYVFIYGIRGDSNMLIKQICYGILCFFIIYLISHRLKLHLSSFK